MADYFIFRLAGIDMSKSQAQETITRLVTRFEEGMGDYKQSTYNETQTRLDFINPFFKALGWDVDNEKGYAEAYREVIHEDKIRISGAVKAPDYSFRLPGGKQLFYVEAKKPSVLIRDQIQPAYQLRRYGWSAKLPISILTDFEEFAIYDCTIKPSENDKPSTGRITYLNYKDYLSNFDLLWDTFSKERVLQGSFDRFIKSDRNKKGTATVDKEFLSSLDTWRTTLAVAVSKQNPIITEDELNFIVQLIIDRIIFLRIAEDRSIEPYGALKEITDSGSENSYRLLLDTFHEADKRYNSGLFDFRKDTISEAISLDNKTIKNIITDLYYPKSPYEFSVLSVDILGSAYEQFLGKTIRLEKNHRAKVEEKPEVRKAGGVYYTPQYIVDYIVQNTVGKLVENKTPEEVAQLTIVDPACGSGSFLLGAYQFLLDWHKEYYTSHKPSKKEYEAIFNPVGGLSTTIKKQILLNNIYGVDIDANAVEVTKLSLLLKCMEGETSATINHQLSFFKERLLPTLDHNIKCGNSLIDLDYFDFKLDLEPTLDLLKSIKPFSWKQNFPSVFSRGGFDAVIGNPPYVRQETLGTLKEYFSAKYRVYHGMADLYSYFIEKGVQLLKPDGRFGIIVANKWMRANYGGALRAFLMKQDIESIIDFGDLPVFASATTYPCILLIRNDEPADSFTGVNVDTLSFSSLEKYVTENSMIVEKSSLTTEAWNLTSQTEARLMQKLRSTGIPLGEYVDGKIFRGILTGLNEAFIITKEQRDELIRQDPKSAEIIKPFLQGKEIKQYQTPAPTSYLIFLPKGFTAREGNNPRNPSKWMSETYPAVFEHLFRYEAKAKARYDKGEYWWELRACDYYDAFEKPKIIFPDIALRMQATIDTQSCFVVNTAYILPIADYYLLGLLNSNLFLFYYSRISSTIRGGYLRYIRQYLVTLPVFQNESDISLSLKSEIINCVGSILNFSAKLAYSSLPLDVQQIGVHIDYQKEKLNQLVYQLYGLTEEEIQIIEDAIK